MVSLLCHTSPLTTSCTPLKVLETGLSCACVWCCVTLPDKPLPRVPAVAMDPHAARDRSRSPRREAAENPLLGLISEPEAQALQAGGVPHVLIDTLEEVFEALDTTERRDRHWSAAMVAHVLNSSARMLLAAEAVVQRRLYQVARTPPPDVRRDRLEVLMVLGRAMPIAVRDVVMDRLETAWLTPGAIHQHLQPTLLDRR